MSESKTQEENIISELQKTGYPTEIVGASIMQQRGWGVLHNPSYLDDREGQSREFDIQAFREWRMEAGGKSLGMGVYLITECKKSDKPWVFFTTEEQHLGVQVGRLIKTRNGWKRFVFWSDTQGKSPLIPESDLRSIHHYFQVSRRARTFHEPFKNQERADHSQMIYTAISSASKATLFHYREESWENFLAIYYPLVIFSGDMFDAQVNANKEVSLSRVDYVQLSHHYIERVAGPRFSDNNGRHEFIVDVVREQYLEQFLTQIEQEHQALAERLQKSLIG